MIAHLWGDRRPQPGHEVMRGQRPLSLDLIRLLNERFGIPDEALIRAVRSPKLRRGA